MRRASLSWFVIGCVAVAHLPGTARAALDPLNLIWTGAGGPSTSRFAGVAIVGGQRVLAGFDFDNSVLSATVYTAIGAPGGTLQEDDLGLSTFDSVAVSVSEDGSGEWWAAAIEALPMFEARSYIFRSDDITNPVAVLGPSPTFSPDVSLNAINRNGVGVGTADLVVPIVSNSAGVSTQVVYPNDAQLWAIDSLAQLYGGAAAPSSGAELAATIWNASGTVLYQDTVPGIVEGIEGDFAVGQSDGRAAYWQRVGMTWQLNFLELPPGTPLLGELQAIDHSGSGFAGGTVEGDRAVAIDLTNGSWVYVDDLAGLPFGTLNRITGVDSEAPLAALSAIAADFSGWDLSASFEPGGPSAVPAPGIWLALPLLCVGLAASRRRSGGVGTSPQHLT